MSQTMKTQDRGNCQCCGRMQAVLAGGRTMSKHGYEVKKDGSYAYFSGICGGNSFMPMQFERKITDALVISARADAIRLDALALKLEAGEEFPALAESDKLTRRPHGGMHYEQVPFAQAPKHKQDRAVESAIWNAQQRSRAARNWADQMERLVNEVYGTPLTIVPIAAALDRIQPGEQRANLRGRVLVSTGQVAASVYWKDEKGFKGKMSSRAWRLLPIAE